MSITIRSQARDEVPHKYDCHRAGQSVAKRAMKRWAAIFDWDGVVIDSSGMHEQSWEQLALEVGKVLPEGFFRTSFGMKNERIIPELLGWTADPVEISQFSLRKEEAYRELVRARGIALLPGVSSWLEILAGAQVPCAIGSSTPRANIDCVIDQLGVEHYFQAIVAGEDVAHGKPDPEVFLLAAGQLGVPPGRSVVFEDAHVGIEAALAASMKVVGVATTHPRETLGRATCVVDRLDELRLSEVEAWFVADEPDGA